MQKIINYAEKHPVLIKRLKFTSLSLVLFGGLLYAGTYYKKSQQLHKSRSNLEQPILLNQQTIDVSSLSNLYQIRTLHTKITLDVNFAQQQLFGLVELTITTIQQIQEILLDIKHLNILSVKVNNEVKRFDIRNGIDALGQQLVIKYPEKINKQFVAQIEFSTKKTDDQVGLNWLNPLQTFGGKHPFLFSQCEPIYARSIFPCQDSPSVKSTFEYIIKVPQPLKAYASGLLERHDELTNTFYFQQPKAIPAYLFAIAVGDLGETKINHRNIVVAEPAILARASKEFEDMEKYLSEIENYLHPYEWGDFKAVVLPKSFPFGGMENPNLTFLSPSVVVGDKSGISTVIHEMVHSWSGNSLTCQNWECFWLNEGLTVFIEREVIRRLYGEDEYKLKAVEGNNTLKTYVNIFGLNHSFSSLTPDVKNTNPDDCFSSIPYEKGFQYLTYLQSLVGQVNFQNFVRKVVKIPTLNQNEFKELLIKEFGDIDLMWDQWVVQPGYAPKELPFEQEFKNKMENYVKQFQDQDLDPQEFERWNVSLKANFLDLLQEKGYDLKTIRLLDEDYQIFKQRNPEILHKAFVMGIKVGYPHAIGHELTEFLQNNGRMKFIKPIYRALVEKNKVVAETNFNISKSGYHSIAKKIIIEPFQDTSDQIPVRRISRTIAYQNSRSIQEEDDENSSSNYKPHHNFLITCPIQPPDGIGSDMRVPTLNTNAQSNKSFERFQIQKDSKRLSMEQEQELVEDKSIISVESNNSLIRSKKTLDENRVRRIMIRFIQKLKPKYNINKFYDSLRDIDSQGEETFFKYRIFTYVQFALLCICNTLSAIYIPLRVVSMLSHEAYIFSQLIQVVTLIQIIFDLMSQRGPFKMIDGTLKTNYKCNMSKILDLFRLSSIILLYILEDNHRISFIFIGIYLILQIYRINEDQENIPILIQQIMVLVLFWVSITIYLMILLKAISQFYTNNVFNNQELGDLEFSLTLAIQLATHNSTIFYQLSNTPEILVVNIYMILTVFLGFYTFSVFFMWVKPNLKQISEKEKVLQEFNEGLVEKNMSYSLQCRTSSYLDFIMNEDFIRLKDQLYKKLSPELQEDFQLQMRSNVISKIKFLNKFSSDFKRAIIYWFDQAQYNPEDIILQENTIDDFSLFYILKGQVKIQFQGPYDGKPKKSFVTLSEGQTFGEFSFISGTIPYISASSYGLSKVLKIKRADFIELIKGYPQDNVFYFIIIFFSNKQELFCAIKESSLTNQNMYECYYCQEQGHKLFQCKYLLYFPNKQKVIEQYIFPFNQSRVACDRRKKGPRTMEILPIVVERVQAFKIKLSQELITSEDLPQSSQIPYSENQTQHSASYVSKTQSIMRKNTSPDNQNSQNNLDDQDQFNDIQHYSEDSLDPFLQINQRNKQNKTTLRTAGFPFQTEFGGEIIQRERLTIFNDLSKPILDQQQSREETNRLSKQSTVQQNSVQNSKLRGQRSMQSKLTFRIQNQTSGQDDSVQIQHQQQHSLKQAGSLRQASNRSNTYSNPISNGLSNNQSNNPSSNSRNNKSPKLSPSSFQPQPPKKEKLPNIPSDKSLQDSRRQSQRKKSTKTGTKVSILNQMSGFQPFQTVENNVYVVNDILTQKFERMQAYKKFFPHNNYDFVIARYNRAQPRLNKFTRKKHPLKAGPPIYSINVFVMSKIRRMKKLLSG